MLEKGGEASDEACVPAQPLSAKHRQLGNDTADTK